MESEAVRWATKEGQGLYCDRTSNREVLNAANNGLSG